MQFFNEQNNTKNEFNDKLLQEVKEDYHLFKYKSKEFHDKVALISNIFSLKGRDILLADVSPSYFVGKFYEKNHFIVFGINPGYILENNLIEEEETRKSWDDYCNHEVNFFSFFKGMDLDSQYYEKLWLLFSGIIGSKSERIDWNFFDSNVTNLNLIPYHSQGINISSFLTAKQFEYLKSRLELNLDFILKYKPKLFIFNGNPWFVLLIKHRLVEKFKKVPITEKFSLYFFEMKGIPSVLFDKFFSAHYWGLTNNHRSKIIPKLIKKFHNRDHL